jgi:hypothetical protein
VAHSVESVACRHILMGRDSEELAKELRVVEKRTDYEATTRDSEVAQNKNNRSPSF